MMNAKIRTSWYKHYIRCGPSTQAPLDLILRAKGLLLANRNRTSDRWISDVKRYSPPLYQLSYRELLFDIVKSKNMIVLIIVEVKSSMIRNKKKYQIHNRKSQASKRQAKVATTMIHDP